MENPAAPLLSERQNSGYNNCFVLGGKAEKTQKDGTKKLVKIRAYIDGCGKVQWLGKDNLNYQKLTHLTYDEANTALLTYRKEHEAPWGRVSLWLENAKYNDLYIFVIDFDKVEGFIDTESPFFKGALQLADKVTRSQGGGFHMFYGVDREQATPLFDGINLLASGTAKSFVCKTSNVTKDSRNKVDFFCDTPHFIYEWEEWDNTVGLTDKTQELYDLINANFELKRPFDFGISFTGDADNGWICLEDLTEQTMIAEMSAGQQLVFSDLKNISCECSPAEWFSTGIDIWHVFGDELGGSVFLWWSKPGHSYNGPGCATTWGHIEIRGMTGKTRLCNTRWRAFLGLDRNAFDEYEAQQRELKEQEKQLQTEQQANMPAEDTISTVLAAEEETTTAEPLTFRDLPIQWEHEARNGNALDGEERGARERHRISWNHIQHDKRDNFFKAAWGTEYKKVRAKVNFKGQTADNVLWLTTGQRTALEYEALYYRYIDELVFVTEQEKKS